MTGVTSDVHLVVYGALRDRCQAPRPEPRFRAAKGNDAQCAGDSLEPRRDQQLETAQKLPLKSAAATHSASVPPGLGNRLGRIPGTCTQTRVLSLARMGASYHSTKRKNI